MAAVAVTVMAVTKTAMTLAARAMVVVVMTAANVTAKAATMQVAAAMATVRNGFVEGICVRNAGAGTATVTRMMAVTVAARQGWPRCCSEFNCDGSSGRGDGNSCCASAI